MNNLWKANFTVSMKFRQWFTEEVTVKEEKEMPQRQKRIYKGLKESVSLDKESGTKSSLERQYIAVMLKNIGSNPMVSLKLQELSLIFSSRNSKFMKQKRIKTQDREVMIQKNLVSWLI